MKNYMKKLIGLAGFKVQHKKEKPSSLEHLSALLEKLTFFSRISGRVVFALSSYWISGQIEVRGLLWQRRYFPKLLS
jgi:hypothetical protein